MARSRARFEYWQPAKIYPLRIYDLDPVGLDQPVSLKVMVHREYQVNEYLIYYIC